MFEPGYYKTNYRALRLREMVRWHGWARGIRSWLRTRFMPMSRHGMWMPGLWAEYECKPEDLSEDFWQATKLHRADFEKLGFVQCRLGKGTRKYEKLFNPSIRDSGAIFYLDSTRCYFAQLIYVRTFVPSQRGETKTIRIGFTAAFQDSTLSCTNRSPTFDSTHTGKIVRIDSNDVPVLYNRFREEMQHCSKAPRTFPDFESLRQWSDGLKIKSFEARVRRGLYIRMTEPEVAAWWAERQRYPAGPPPPVPRRRFQLNLVTTTFVVLGVISTIIQLHRHRTDGSINIDGNSMSENTIEYQGQQFKLSRSYAEYDDYKDDPNNLDTNELPRIERTMESVKIPASFKNFDDFVNFTSRLDFPGYGQGGGGGQADDGSTFQFVSIEIPQADKERVVVGQSESENWQFGSWKLVDDFIYAGSDTNSINRVQLEHGQLEYFDRKGRVLRKKAN